MKFIRNIIATYKLDVSKYANKVAIIEGTRITTRQITKTQNALMFTSECDYKSSSIINGTAIVEECLYESEKNIENIADIISLETASGRSISSSCPGAALVPENDVEIENLRSFSKWQCLNRPRCIPNPDLRMDLLGNLKIISDREDGLPLLAATVNHNSAIGTLHDIIRIFERGFSLSDKKLINPLTSFLSSGFGKYSHNEIHGWITKLRHPATHADKRDKYLLDRDVCIYIPRMMQAAYDVYFNKATWRGNDSARRSEWRPVPYIGPDNSIHIIKGMGARMQMQVFDEFGSYPQNLEAVFSNKPKNWITPNIEDPAPAPDLIIHTSD